jgi:hypothetical protein
LIQKGRSDLASRVKWVSRDLGDGLGYDIESIDTAGHPVFIEVKATNQGKDSLFFITLNELRVARREAGRYKLYRVFDLSTNPKIYILHGPLDDKLHLQARTYVASPYSVALDG